MTRSKPPLILSFATLLLASAAPAAANRYADLADLTLAAAASGPTIVRATITGTERIADHDSPGLAGGHTRLLVSAHVDAAIVAPGATPAMLSWLWDAPNDARGKAPKPKNLIVLAWLTPPAADGKTRLTTPDSQQPWDAASEAQIRAIATEARGGSVPIITGVANGFRADGTVAGESESQFFLTAVDGKGLTMVVTARPGEARRITVARGDVIDESAIPVRGETLLWYRLACFLPTVLPDSAGGKDKALAGDWQAALASLGRCRN